MSSTSTKNAANGLITTTAVSSREKRPLNNTNAEAGPSNLKRPRTDSTLDDLYGDNGTPSNQPERGELKGYLVVDIVERAQDVSEAEWFRRVEVKARLEVFKLQLAGKAQSGPAVIQCVSWSAQYSFIISDFIFGSKSQREVDEDSLVWLFLVLLELSLIPPRSMN